MAISRKVSGKQIRAARHRKGLTQAALARAVGVSERNIVRWENDQHEPRFEHVAAIAEATGHDIDFFLTGADSDDDEEAAPVNFEDALRLMVRRVVREEAAQA